MRSNIERIGQHIIAHDQGLTHWRPLPPKFEHMRQQLLAFRGTPQAFLERLAETVGTGQNAPRLP